MAENMFDTQRRAGEKSPEGAGEFGPSMFLSFLSSSSFSGLIGMDL